MGAENYQQNTDFELEEYIIGCILLDTQCLFHSNIKIKSKMFEVNDFRKTFIIIETLLEQGKSTFDSLEIISHPLNKELKINAYTISVAMERCIFHSTKFDNRCMALIEKHTLRQIENFAMDLIQRKKEGEDLDGLLCAIGKFDEDINNNFLISNKNKYNIKTVINGSLKQLEQRMNKESVGVELDFCLAYKKTLVRFENGELVGIAARPSMGKTARALWLARNISKKYYTQFYSIEMTDVALGNRMLQSKIDEKRFPSHVFKTGDITPEDFEGIKAVAKDFDSLNLEIIDDIKDVEMICRNIIKSKPKIAFIDYLGLITGYENTDNENHRVGRITKRLKDLAKKMNIPIVALIQLNRQVENRGSKIPNLSDLRDSGEIEQDLDIIMFEYREDAYHQDERDYVRDFIQKSIIKKNRNYQLGIIETKHNAAINEYYDVDDTSLQLAQYAQQEIENGIDNNNYEIDLWERRNTSDAPF